MNVIGLDLSTNTGWANIKDGRLQEYGSIHLDSQMELPQRLNFFNLELNRVLLRIKPDWVFIEDVILAISGARTLSYLARINGVAIISSFSVVQERIKLYTPDYWKSHSMTGLSGHAKKWQVQLAAIKHFSIPVVGKFELIESMITDQSNRILEKKADYTKIRETIEINKKLINSKRNPLSDLDKQVYMNMNRESEKDVITIKSEIKKMELEFDKKMMKVGVDLTSQTGISCDIADAIGVAICGLKEI